MIHIIIDENRCKACGLCESICPVKALKINPAHPAKSGRGCAEYTGGCLGCGSCATVCPDIAITIKEAAE